jgi:hypothetical protein
MDKQMEKQLESEWEGLKREREKGGGERRK